MRQMTRCVRISTMLSVVALCLVLIGCGSKPEPSQAAAPAPAPPPQAAPKLYEMKGKVVAVDKEGKKLTVDHQDIPGFMGAMTMPYPVKDAALLDPLSPGDQITANVVSAAGDYWLENIIVAK